MKCQFSSSSWGSCNQMHVHQMPHSHCISTANIYELILHCVSIIFFSNKVETTNFNDQISFGFIFGSEWWSACADPAPGCNLTCLMCLMRRPNPKVIQGGRNVHRLWKDFLFFSTFVPSLFIILSLKTLLDITLCSSHSPNVGHFPNVCQHNVKKTPKLFF